MDDHTFGIPQNLSGKTENRQSQRRNPTKKKEKRHTNRGSVSQKACSDKTHHWHSRTQLEVEHQAKTNGVRKRVVLFERVDVAKINPKHVVTKAGTQG